MRRRYREPAGTGQEIQSLNLTDDKNADHLSLTCWINQCKNNYVFIFRLNKRVGRVEMEIGPWTQIKIYLLHFLNQEKKFWSSYVFFAPVTLNSLFKKTKIMLMRTRLAKVGGAHAPLSSRTSSRDSYVVVWILQPLMYLDWISFLFRFTFLLAAPQISFDFWTC